MLSRKALSPLVATILLVVFALIIGTATMSWGKNFVRETPDRVGTSFGSSLVINYDYVDNPLKELQVKYITGKLSLEEYLLQEEEIIKELG